MKSGGPEPARPSELGRRREQQAAQEGGREAGGSRALHLCLSCPTCVVSVAFGEPEPTFSALTLKRSLPFFSFETLRIVKVELVVVVTFNLLGLRWWRLREAVASRPCLPTSRRPTSLNLSSGLEDRTEFEVVEAEAPSRIVEEGVGNGGKRHTRGTYRLEEAPGGGTSISFELEWLKASRAERLIPPLSGAFVRRVNTKAMRRLAKLLDGS